MKKRLLKTSLFFLSLTALMCVMIFSVSAKTVTYGRLKFDVKSNKATLVEYTGKSAEVKIPSKVSGATVTAIGNEAFWSNKTLKSVTIPSTVTSIGIAAFNECSALTKVVIPYKVKSIGESAFWFCTNLKTVVIPKATEKIGKNAFRGCTNATVYVTKGSYGEKYIKAQKDAKLGYRYMSAITLSSSSLSVSPDKTVRLTVKASPSVVYYKKFTYSSSNKNVATVDSYGRIKGVSCGSATITVKAADGSGLSKKCTVKVAPAQITKLSQTNVTPTSYTLSWSAVKGATHYKLYTYNSSTKKWGSLDTTTKLSYKVSGLTAGSSKYFKIMPYAKIGNFNFCGKISKSFKFSSAVPEAATNLKATVGGIDTVNLSWDKAAYATGYRVYIYDLAAKKYLYQFNTPKLTAKMDGLYSGTKYGFIIRSYAMADGKTVLGKSNSNLVYCTTRPDYVTDLTVNTQFSTANSLTLEWKAVKGVSGYRVSMWDNEKNAYVTLKNIYGEENTSFIAENLSENTEYKFTVRTFIKNSELIFGYNCKAVTGTTLKEPETKEELFTLFTDAYNKTKASTDVDLFRAEQSSGNDINAPAREFYEPIVSSVFGESTQMYMLTEGKTADGKTLNDLLTPSGAPLNLTFSQIDEESFVYTENGSGNDVIFTVPSEDKSAIVNSLFAPVIDWEKIAQENPGFVLTSCTYEGTKVKAKVNQNGSLDDMEISIPVSVSFTLDGVPYSFSGTVTHNYMFVCM